MVPGEVYPRYIVSPVFLIDYGFKVICLFKSVDRILNIDCSRMPQGRQVMVITISTASKTLSIKSRSIYKSIYL